MTTPYPHRLVSVGIPGDKLVALGVGEVACECSSLRQLPDLSRTDIAIVDYDRLAQADRANLGPRFPRSWEGPHLVLVSSGGVRADLPQLLDQGTLANLVSTAALAKGGLRLTVDELRGGRVKLADRITDPTHEVSLVVRSSTQKGELHELVERFGRNCSMHPRLLGQLALVAEELFTNAVFNAPIDESGVKKFRHVDRTQVVNLSESEAVEVKLSANAQCLGVEVADAFGSLEPAHLLGYLAKCFRRGVGQIDSKQGGAGLGLYQVFEAATQMVVCLEPGRATRMTGLFSAPRDFREFAATPKSFNLFYRGSGAGGSS